MFAEIIDYEELEKSYEFYLKGEDGTAMRLIQPVIAKISTRRDEFFRKIALNTIIWNICMLMRYIRKLKKGISELSKLSKWFDDKYAIEVLVDEEKPFFFSDYSRICEGNIITFVEEIKLLKKHSTAVLEVIASWSALLVAITALLISVCNV